MLLSTTSLPVHALILHHPPHPPPLPLPPTPEVAHRVLCEAKKGMVLSMISKPKIIFLK